MSQYITAEEAVRLSQQNTTAEFYAAKDIYDLYQQVNKQEPDQKWLFACTIATIYNAGRVAGIRQERVKRNRGVSHVR